MTHAQLLDALEKSGNGMHRVTLYRSLEKLSAARMLLKVVDAHRVSRYALAVSQDRYTLWRSAPRFTCQVCQRQFLLRADAADEALSTALSRAGSLGAAAGHQALEVDFSVRGICNKCVAS